MKGILIRRLPQVIVAAIGFLASSSLAPAGTLRVPSEYPTITSAMEVASAGDTVLVAPGVYDQYETRTGSLGIGYVTTAAAVVFMADGVILLSEAGRDNTTIRYDAPGGGGILDGAILAGGFAESGTTIDGFAITGSTPNAEGVWTGLGEDLTVRNCRFVDLGVDRDDAAGIYDIRTALTVTNCEFLRCSLVEQPYGAAIEVLGDDLVVEDCLFEDCVGGAVRVDGYSPWGGDIGRVSNCVFRNNIGKSLVIAERLEFFVEDCLFIGNVVEDGAGAAVHVSHPATTAYVRRNLFVNNRVLEPGNGGVLYWNRPQGEIAFNTFVGSHGESGAAGQIRGDPGLSIFNNIFADCTGGVALSLFLYSGQPGGGCNLFWNNVDGNAYYYELKDTDVEADPRFCDSPGGDFTVSADSPCIPPGSGACGQIGLFGQGCGTISIQSESWGSVKERYRDTDREGETP